MIIVDDVVFRQLSAVHSTRSAPGRLLRVTVEIPTDVGPLGVTIVEATRRSTGVVAGGPKFFIAAIDDRSFAAQYESIVFLQFSCLAELLI